MILSLLYQKTINKNTSFEKEMLLWGHVVKQIGTKLSQTLDNVYIADLTF